MRIIPAIDIINGKCVRLTKGNYATQKIYNTNPLEVAKQFEDAGLKYLHLVDLDGAKSKHIVNHKVLCEIATNTKLIIDFGGGIKTHNDVKIAFENGASQITGGSIAATNAEVFCEWISIYGSPKIILGADFINRKIATSGWHEYTDLDVLAFIKTYVQKGIEYVACTDISKDGMLAGTSNEIYEEIVAETQVKLIASGGVSGLADLEKLKEIGCEAAIVGKAIYEQKINLKELATSC